MGLQSLDILLADDDTDDCLFFREALEEMPVTANLKTVQDGEKLMQMLTGNTGAFPHILFLDLNMPRKNGFECLSEIKQTKDIKHIPVVIFSTSVDQMVADLLYKNGAHLYIQKPADFAYFKKVIFDVLALVLKGDFTQPPRENFIIK